MAVLNNIDHSALCYTPQYGNAFSDRVNRMPLLPNEFAEAQRDHPILFANEPDTGMMAVALLGLESGENLHFNGHDWGAAYVPAMHRRGPFSLRVQKDSSGTATDLLIEVDLDDVRLSSETGIPLFKAHGGNSEMLDMISGTLLTIFEGSEIADRFAQMLSALGLLVPAAIEVELGDGRSVDIRDHFIVDAAVFETLGATQLKQLNDAGFLVPAVHAMTSVANIQRLIDRKVGGRNRA
jgi:hypothetical protein